MKKILLAIAIIMLLLYSCTPQEPQNGEDPDPGLNPAPSPTIFEAPIGKDTPLLETEVMPRADTPYQCDITVHMEPLPYCVNWARWWYYSDIFSEDGTFATRQYFGPDGIYEQVLNYSEYVDNVELEFRCQYGVHTFNYSTEQWIWVNVTPDDLQVFASDPDWISDITEKSWSVWCDKEEAAFAECFFSYNAMKTPYYSCKNTLVTEPQIYIFALTKDDTLVQKLDWYRNGTFYRSELNPPYDYLSPATYFEGTDGLTISIGTSVTLRNGTVIDNYDYDQAGFLTWDLEPTPTPTPTPTPSPTEPPEICGDGICEGSETCENCPVDCGECPPVCGDGNCDAGDGEDCLTCPEDCPVCPPCDCCQYCPQTQTVMVEDYMSTQIDGIDFMCVVEGTRLVCYEN